MTPISVACLKCGAPVEVYPSFTVGGTGVVCDACIAEEERARARSAVMCERAAKWQSICPSRYVDTDVTKLPCPGASRNALTWAPGDIGHGLNLWGCPNAGKTRSMLLVLKRQFMSGKSVYLLLAGKFEEQLEKRAWKRAPWIEGLCRVDVLAFDDLDKCAPMSRDYEKVLFSILDRRMASKKPVLLTHNSTAQVLEYKFKNGEAMVRRIRDFTKSVYFKPNATEPTDSIRARTL